MSHLTKKSVIISATILLVAISALVWAINRPDEQSSDNLTSPSGQSDTQTTQPNEAIPEEEFEEQNNQPTEVNDNVPQETPAQDVDDRGGYTPY